MPSTVTTSVTYEELKKRGSLQGCLSISTATESARKLGGRKIFVCLFVTKVGCFKLYLKRKSPIFPSPKIRSFYLYRALSKFYFVCRQIALFLASFHRKKVFCYFAAKHLNISLISLNGFSSVSGK